jgi:hypothetical protein
VKRESADAFGQVVQTGFGLPVASAKWFAALFGRRGWRLCLAYDGEAPIASGAAFAADGVAWFGMDVTLTKFRRRGAQTALINRRIKDGLAARLLGFTAETGNQLLARRPRTRHTATTDALALRRHTSDQTTSARRCVGH